VLAELVGVVGGDDADVVDESLDGSGCVAEAELGGGLAFDGVELASIVGEFVVAEAFGETLEQTAGVDFGELLRVADEDELGVGLGGFVDDGSQASVAEHSCFVDDEHSVGVAASLTGVEVEEESVGGVAGDAGAAFEFGCGPGGECHADDGVAR